VKGLDDFGRRFNQVGDGRLYWGVSLIHVTVWSAVAAYLLWVIRVVELPALNADELQESARLDLRPLAILAGSTGALALVGLCLGAALSIGAAVRSKKEPSSPWVDLERRPFLSGLEGVVRFFLFRSSPGVRFIDSAGAARLSNRDEHDIEKTSDRFALLWPDARASLLPRERWMRVSQLEHYEVWAATGNGAAHFTLSSLRLPIRWIVARRFRHLPREGPWTVADFLWARPLEGLERTMEPGLFLAWSAMAAALLVCAPLRQPIWYYKALRLVVFFGSIFGMYFGRQLRSSKLVAAYALCGLIYWPGGGLYLGKPIWTMLNMIAFGLIVHGALKARNLSTFLEVGPVG
jgi:hypothetical protein